jgi:6-phosphogluconate dehydrogenase
MQLGMIGLGRMGASMVSRLLQGGHQYVVFDMKLSAMRFEFGGHIEKKQ